MRHAGWALLLSLCGYWIPVIPGTAAADTGTLAAAKRDITTPDAAAKLDTAAVDSVVAEWLSGTGAPSASIAIVQEGRLTYARAYGAARLTPTVPARVTTRYAIDSISKEFTAASVLLLAEQGKLLLDDPVARWFPDLHEAAAVTLRQLLTHTSGIRDFWPQDFLTPEMTRPTSVAALIDEWVKRPLDFEPGTDWQYSNTGYALAGAIVEKVSGESLFEFQSQHVFAPLHMTHVAEYSPSVGQASSLGNDDAAGHTRHGLGPVQSAPKEAAGWLFGSANLAMQPSDLALWDVSLMNRSLLKADSYTLEFEPVMLKNGHVQPYALGLDVESVQGRLRIGHSGGGSGFLTDNRFWPRERVAIVVLTNNDWASPSDLADRLALLALPANAAEARARAVFTSLQTGTLDRSLFTAVGNFHLTAQVLADLRTSLSELGPARLFELEQESRRGGMLTRRWKVLCRDARLDIVERGYPNGKLDQFMITPKFD